MACRQCSRDLQNKVKSVKGYEAFEGQGKIAELLKTVRDVMSQVEPTTYVWDSIDEAKSRYYKYKQCERDSNAIHMRNVKHLVETVEHLGGDLFNDVAALTKEFPNQANDARTESARDRIMGMDLIKRADPTRYAGLLNDIKNQYVLGKNVYPQTLRSAYEVLESYNGHRQRNWRNDRTHRGSNQQQTGLQYFQNGEMVAGVDGRTCAHTTCFT